MKSFLQNPAQNLNELNKIVPELVKKGEQIGAQKSLESFEKVLNALDTHSIPYSLVLED